ncbi:hypothetical protein HN748_01210 [Candidatus Peregrinibacteria bacterium]|jgi:hypothetical protein|nr:hypothetical protein [Candidatus Peregrinibacteria bacterium]MBT7702829.1 hypothetical protein [Candidatus Peregrinibacteria bacterium]
MDTKKKKAERKAIYRVVQGSSKLEGLSFIRARRNKAVITKLKKHGRGFSI